MQEEHHNSQNVKIEIKIKKRRSHIMCVSFVFVLAWEIIQLERRRNETWGHSVKYERCVPMYHF